MTAKQIYGKDIACIKGIDSDSGTVLVHDCYQYAKGLNANKLAKEMEKSLSKVMDKNPAYETQDVLDDFESRMGNKIRSVNVEERTIEM